MNDAIWYYLKDRQQIGPVTETDLLEAFNNGDLKNDAFVWCKELANWTPAWEVSLLNLPPPPPTAATAAELAPAVSQVRPWLRFWARLVDLGLFFMVGFIIYGAIGFSLDDGEFLAGLVYLWGWIILEPLILAAWGTTPGKALFKIKLQHADGQTLPFKPAFRRSFTVMFKGLGAGLPIVSLITLVISYFKAKSDGITSWDKANNFTVSHQEISTFRIIGVPLVGFSFCFLFLIILCIIYA